MPIKVVLDTSIIIKWFNRKNEKFVDQALKILDQVKTNNIILYEPTLLILEFINVLHKGKKLKPKEIQLYIRTLNRIGIRFGSIDKNLTKRIIKQLKEVPSLTSYDATFLAFAKLKKAKFITDDKRQEVADFVILLKNYS